MIKNLFLAFIFLNSLLSFSTTIEKDSLLLYNKITSEKNSNYSQLLDKYEYKKLTDSQFKKIIALNEKTNLAVKIYSLNTLGVRFRRNLKYKESIEYHQKALELSNTTKDIEAQVHSFNMLGVCYRKRLDVQKALDNHQEVLKIATDIETPSKHILLSIGVAQNSIGEIYIELKQYELAIEQFENAIETQNSLKNERGLAINYGSLGDIYIKKNELDKAINNYRKSLFYNKKINSKLGQVICNTAIANIFIDKGKNQEALRTIESIYSYSLELKDKHHLARTLSTIGRVNLQLGNLKLAEDNLLESYSLYNNTTTVKNSDFTNVCIYLSDLYEKNDDFQKSLSYYKEGVIQERKTSNRQNVLYVSNLISRFDIQQKRHRIRDLQEKSKAHFFETSKTRNILIITLVSLALLTVALYSIYRQRLLNNDKKVLTLEQDALQAQMNPHFIFNALNSIKLYIINNDQREAVYYLNKFSKLIRNILDTSKKKEVSLGEELDTMDLYVSIENIRFNNEIKYKREVDGLLNLDTIKLPPLILQPFLENAIWHGLSSKKDDKQVALTVKKISEGLIEIYIQDNGVGRKRAMEIKENKSLNRKSVGIDLTEERLKTFTSDYLTESYLKYIDLKDDKGNPIGTKVVIGVPLE